MVCCFLLFRAFEDVTIGQDTDVAGDSQFRGERLPYRVHDRIKALISVKIAATSTTFSRQWSPSDVFKYGRASGSHATRILSIALSPQSAIG